MPDYLSSLPEPERQRYRNQLCVDGVAIDDPYAVNKACWTSDVKLLPPKSTAHVVVYLVFSPSQFTAGTVQAYKSLEAYDYFHSVPHCRRDQQTSTKGVCRSRCTMAQSDGGGADEGPADGPVKGSYPPYLPELPELRVIIEEASGVAQPAEGDNEVSLLGQYTSALPAHRKSTQSRRLDGAHKKRFAEKQNAKSSYQETAPGPGEMRTLRRLKTKKRTVQGKTVITKFTTRKEEEQSTMSPTGEKDCRRNVDESGTTDENIETHEEELVETYGDD
ncbi:hypothetical protein HPB47_009868 [Ixodes persulcatus]|uniref:Uncharacterized protein n=1 Tax=Ixodes persulcatus TaxID=34615 RepID=A0AC60P101_IXOPE|nr:hypothetical protein HPB47_009868 [Ixodes persulcatus]